MFFWLKKVLWKRGVRILLEIVAGSAITNNLLSLNSLSFYHNSCDLPDMSCPQNTYLYFLELLLTACGASKRATIWEPLKKHLFLFSLCFYVFSNVFQIVFIILLKCLSKISTEKKKIKSTPLCCFPVNKFETIRPNLIKCNGFYYYFVWIISVKK